MSTPLRAKLQLGLWSGETELRWIKWFVIRSSPRNSTVLQSALSPATVRYVIAGPRWRFARVAVFAPSRWDRPCAQFESASLRPGDLTSTRFPLHRDYMCFSRPRSVCTWEKQGILTNELGSTLPSQTIVGSPTGCGSMARWACTWRSKCWIQQHRRVRERPWSTNLFARVDRSSTFWVYARSRSIGQTVQNEAMAPKETSTAAECLRFTSLFEAEVLAQLLLDRWRHPQASGRTFASELVEQAREVLQQSRDGAVFIDNLEPQDMNFIAAVWYVEWLAVQNDAGIDHYKERVNWLKNVRHTFPSCFCDPSDLP